jgi:hypothetical protein
MHLVTPCIWASIVSLQVQPGANSTSHVITRYDKITLDKDT